MPTLPAQLVPFFTQFLSYLLAKSNYDYLSTHNTKTADIFSRNYYDNLISLKNTADYLRPLGNTNSDIAKVINYQQFQDSLLNAKIQKLSGGFTKLLGSTAANDFAKQQSKNNIIEAAYRKYAEVTHTKNALDLSSYSTERDLSKASDAMSAWLKSHTLNFKSNHTPTIKDGVVIIDGTSNSTTFTLNGSANNDVIFITYSKTRSIINGGAGDDVIYSARFNSNTNSGDIIHGDSGNDTIYLQSSSYALVDGDDGNDTIIENGGGVSTINGGNGNDYINSNGQATNIIGGAGNDTIIKYNIGDVDGGEGDDTINIYNNYFSSNIHGGTGNDYINVFDGASNIYGGNGQNIITAVNNTGSHIYGGADIDNITVSGTNNNVNAGDGNDIITSSGFKNSIQAEAGNDTIYYQDNIGGEGNLYSGGIWGGDGNDKIYLKGSVVNSAVNLFCGGGNGDDIIDASQVTSNIANLRITYSGNFEFAGIGKPSSGIILSGGLGNDNITGSNFNDCIMGDYGNEIIKAGAGNDYVYGQDNDDIIFGNAGADRLSGGRGSDTFSYSNLTDSTDSSTDLITDFISQTDRIYPQGQDKIDLSGITNESGQHVFNSVGNFTISYNSTIDITTLDDNNSNFAINFSGNVHLTNADFIF